MTATDQGKLFEAADFAAIAIGQTATLSRTIGRDSVDAFARLSGDYNPLHMDDGFARGTTFQKRVVHGMLVASYVSTLIGMHLPGPGALWTQQSFRWQAPVFIGDEITVELKVLRKSEGTRMLTLGVEAVNQQGAMILQGEGTVILLSPKRQAEDVPLGERVAFVTGGSRGIGAAISKALAEAGARVAVNYRNDAASAGAVCDAICRAGGNAMAAQADVTDADAVGDAFRSVQAVFGQPVDLLINNAAPAFIPRPFQEMSWEEVQALLDIHVRGAFNCIQAALPGMKERKTGRIINIASAIPANGAGGQWSAFHVAKEALRALTRSLAVEVGPLGIRVNTVSPGMTETESIAAVPERARKLHAMQTPLRRLCQPEDVARAVVFLAGAGGEFLSGMDLPVAGGL